MTDTTRLEQGERAEALQEGRDSEAGAADLPTWV